MICTEKKSKFKQTSATTAIARPGRCYLPSQFGRWMELVCDLITQEHQTNEALLRRILREEFQAITIQSTPKISEPKAEDVNDDVLGFLRSL